MVFKKFKKAHQPILQNWLNDEATRTHLGGILPLDNFIHYITTVAATEHLSFLVFKSKEPIGMVDIEFTPNEKIGLFFLFPLVKEELQSFTKLLIK